MISVEAGPQRGNGPPAPSTAGTGVVGAATFVLAFALLGFGARWSAGVAGGGDAWQNLWNFRHIDASLKAGTSLFRTSALWYPEGAGLGAHCQSLSLSVPGALAGRLTGSPAAYNLTVVLSFALAAMGTFRLAQRIGVGAGGAAVAALCFAFAPPRVARAYGHLNLLGLCFLPFALEGLVSACRTRGRRRVPGALEAVIALAALAYADYYLAILGALACISFGAFDLARAPRGDRLPRLAVLTTVGLLSVGLALPQLRATLRDAGRVATGHESKWCSVALTSLVVPSRIQVASGITRPLTERNHQNLVEGVGYLGIVPLLATLAVVLRRRSREIDFALLAGGAALLVSLGPQVRVFDRLLDFSLPYAALESWAPGLKLGGCVNRFEQLVFLPLALGLGLWIDRRLRSGTGRAITLAALALFGYEYLPKRIPVESWPMNPPDSAMSALAAAQAGAVLDVDMGTDALVRQLAHGRPLTFGYLSREPSAQAEARRDDPVVGPLVAAQGATDLSAAAVAAHLEYRWGVTHVVVPATPVWKDRMRGFGLAAFSESDRSAVFVPAPARSVPILEIRPESLGHDPPRASTLVSWGFEPYAVETWAGSRYSGCWTSGDAGLVFPATPGRYILRLDSAPGSAITRVAVTWGLRRNRIELLVHGPKDVPFEVADADLSRTGWLGLSLSAPTVPGPSGMRMRGVLFAGLVRD